MNNLEVEIQKQREQLEQQEQLKISKWSKFLEIFFTTEGHQKSRLEFSTALNQLPELNRHICKGLESIVANVYLPKLLENFDANRFLVSFLLSITGTSMLTQEQRGCIGLSSSPSEMSSNQTISTLLEHTLHPPWGGYLCKESEEFLHLAIETNVMYTTQGCMYAKVEEKAAGLCFASTEFLDGSCVIRGVWYRCLPNDTLALTINRERERRDHKISSGGVWVPARPFLNPHILDTSNRAELIEDFVLGKKDRRLELLSKYC